MSFSRRTRRHASLKLRTVQPRLEPLDKRLLLSGFGPQDGAYIVEPWVGGYSDVQIQPLDQKIVAAGTTSVPKVALARYDSAGSPDLTYGSGGLSIAQGVGFEAQGLVLQGDGKAVVAAGLYSNGYFYIGAGRFNSGGALDSAFGSGGWTGIDVGADILSTATSVGLTSTGNIVMGGFLSSTAFSRTAALAGFNADGSLDTGFGDVADDGATGTTFATFGGQLAEFNSLVVQSDDKVVAVGDFSIKSAVVGQLLVARYTAGVLDTTFNGTGYSILTLPEITNTTVVGQNDVALQSDGKIVVVTSTYGPVGSSGTLVVRYTVDGALDTTFGAGKGYVRLATGTPYGGQDLVIQPDGKIVAVSSLDPRLSTPGKVAVTRLNPDGTLDGTFGAAGLKLAPAGPNFHVRGVALRSDGSIIVAGSEGYEATQHPVLMRFYGTPSAPRAASFAPGTPATETLTVGAEPPLDQEAIAIWQARGAGTSRLGNVDLVIANPPDATLDMSSGDTIFFDSNAAGRGWFAGRWLRRGQARPATRTDLLSALTHE